MATIGDNPNFAPYPQFPPYPQWQQEWTRGTNVNMEVETELARARREMIVLEELIEKRLAQIEEKLQALLERIEMTEEQFIHVQNIAYDMEQFQNMIRETNESMQRDIQVLKERNGRE